MAVFQRINGSEFFEAGVLYSTSQIDTYKITVNNQADAAQDLRAQNGIDGVIEFVMREISPLMYFVTDDASGTIHVVTDNHHNGAETLQIRLRNLAEVNGVDVSGTVVELGGEIAVTAGTPVQTGDSE